MSNQSKTWTAMVQQQEDEVFIPLPDELINQLGWNDGDNLNFQIKDGSLILSNQSIRKSE
jgi:antitoxin component of MazEF toxin-antitoxin module